MKFKPILRQCNRKQNAHLPSDWQSRHTHVFVRWGVLDLTLRHRQPELRQLLKQT